MGHILDPERVMDALKDGTVDQIKGMFPIKGKKHTLVATNIYAGNETDIDDIQSQRKAKLMGRTWSTGIYGDFNLVDNASGKVLDKKSIKLLNLPQITRRYSYIVDGTEYQVDNQWRLKSGVYTRERADGDLETQFNLKKGRGFRMLFDPVKKSFSLRYDTSNIKLAPVLKALGVSDEQMKAAWGDEIFKQASKSSTGKDLQKMAKALDKRAKVTSDADAIAVIKDKLGETELRSDTTKVTLGGDFNKVDTPVLLAASGKLLRVHRGEDEVDNRDALQFKELWGTKDFIPERIKNSNRRITRKLTNNLDRKDSVRSIVSSDIFNLPVKAFFTSTNLAQLPSQTNPVDMISGHMRTTVLGSGGISTPNAVSHEAKMIDSSHLGFLDPVATPEGEKTGITLHLGLGVTQKGKEAAIKLYSTKEKKEVVRTPVELANSVIAFPDQYVWKNGKPSPKSKMVTVSSPSEVDPRVASPSEVDYVITSPKAMFGLTANLIPFLPSDQANRAEMATRHIEQAISLKNREAPLVQTHTGNERTGDSWESVVGEYASHKARVSGVVSAISPSEIKIKDSRGKIHPVQIYDNYPLNDKKTFITSTPLVKVGDKVSEGDIVADTNYTKDGVLSLGTNLRIAYLPYKGFVFEDGIAISESASQKLTSEHLYKERKYVDKNMMVGLKKFRAHYPAAMTDENAAKLDEDGVIKKGQRVNPGDIITTVLQKTEPSKEQLMLKGIHRSLVKPYKDKSSRWEKNVSGVVTDVVKNGREYTVMIRTEEPAGVGDKLSGRYGNKGVITQVIPDEEMPHDKDGNAIQIIVNPSGVPGRVNPAQVHETKLAEVAFQTGSPYMVNNFEPDDEKKIVKVGGHYRTVKTKEGPKQVYIEAYEYERGYSEMVKEEMAKHNVPHTQELIDPTTGKSLGQVLVGRQYILKLLHQIDKKSSARSHGYGNDYDSSLVPKGGGKSGAQKFGGLGLYAMLAHGATANIRDGLTYKCFLYHEKIMTDHGEMEIGKVVTNKLPVKVLSIDEEGVVDYRPITNYWRKPNEEEHLTKLTTYGRHEDGSFTKSTIMCTPGHKFFTDLETKVEAQSLVPGVDELVTTGYALTPSQKQLLIGSLFGDGYLAYPERCAFPYFQERHSSKQAEYLGWKASVLRTLSKRSLREYRAGFEGFSNGGLMVEWSTGGHPELRELHDLFYASGERRFTEEAFASLELPGLAVWFQDDGSAFIPAGQSNVCVNFAVCAMSDDEKSRAVDRIEQLTGVRFNVNDGYLRKYGLEARKFLAAVAPYVHQSMQYKLHTDVGDSLDYFQTPTELSSISVPVVSNELVTTATLPAWRGKYLFNLEVGGTHRYFVRGVLVGNSDKSQDDVWTAIQAGEIMPAPKPSFVYEKFTSYLNALGVNVEKEGNGLTLVPLTDDEIKGLSNGELKNPSRVLRGKDLKPEEGGLFDEDITGGPGGDKWSHIELADPIPNPMFAKPLQNLLNLKAKEFKGIIDGTLGFAKDGSVVSAKEAVSTGPTALVEAIKNYDVDSNLENSRKALETARGTDFNTHYKRVKYLEALKKADMSPEEAYVLENLPVLPPIFRPVTVMEGGDLNIDGINMLYRDVALINDKLDTAKDVLPDKQLAAPRADLYDAMKALMATGTMSREGEVMTDGTIRPPGVMSLIAGTSSPKYGFFQSKVVDRKQDLTMRSVITPDLSLHLDEVGLPRKGAMEIYKPFVVKELVRMGHTPLSAKEEIEKNSILANKALDVAVNKRPVLMKRDPVLHKFGVMAFRPKLHDKYAIHIHPLLVGGYNADFDGDQMGIFVPVSNEAVEESYKMMPSKNLFSPATGRAMYQPSLEGQLGLFLLTQFGKDSGKSFKSLDAALAAGKSGDIKMTDVVTVGGKKTTAGRISFFNALPTQIRNDSYLYDKNKVMNGKNLQEALKSTAKSAPQEFQPMADRLKDLGFGYAYNIGFSFTEKDFDALVKIRGKHLKAAEAKIAAFPKGLSREQHNKRLIDVYTKATADMKKEALVKLEKDGNNLFAMYSAGVKPGWLQLQQLVLAPMLLQNAKSETIPVPVTRSYSEGVDSAGYWVSSSGARKGLIEKVQSVSKPGALSKQIMNTVMPYVVVSDDCGTNKGISLPTTDRDVADRYLAKPVALAKGRVLPAGTLVTPNHIADMKASKVSKVVVRSPLKCKLPKGLCGSCYGNMDHGGKPQNGTNIGAIAGQAIGERGTQLSMKTFHTGGVAGSAGKVVGSLDRITQLLKMPAKLPNSAILSPSSGDVKSVTKSAAGGWDVTVGSKTSYVPASRGLTVKVGDSVKRGDRLSSGTINPKELLEHTNIDTVQRYLSDEIHGVYANEGIKRRNVEVVTKALTNLGMVDDPGDSSEFIKGDYISLSHANDISSKMKNPIKVTPVLRGVETLALDQTTDWMARMQYRKIKETLLRGASERWTSDIHGLHPIPGIVYSAEFGKKKGDTKGPY